MSSQENSIRSRILSIIIIGFFLNLLWEVLHSTLYDWNTAPLINDIYIYCIRISCFASAYDALWIFSFILINSIIQKSFKWLTSPKKRDFITFCILGIVCAILIELQAIVFNQWSYNEWMPEILGLGLTPLIQLAITSMISLYITSKIEWKK